MARRGVMNALQAALAGISGAAGGYVQMEERKRKQMLEDEERRRREALDAAGLRAEQREIARMGGMQIAGMGEQVAGPVPSAIPLSGVGNAFAAAERMGGPATSRGAMRQEVGGTNFIIPSERERVAGERETLKAYAAEDFDTINRRNFATYKRIGGTGEYNPSENYEMLFKDLQDRRRNADGGQTVASIRKDINDKVAQFRSSVMRMELDVPDPNRVGRTMKVRLKPAEQKQMIDEYRRGLEQDYGLTSPTPDTRRDGGTRMSFQPPAGGNIGTILDRTTAFGAEGPFSPMTWQSSSGKTYQF